MKTVRALIGACFIAISIGCASNKTKTATDNTKDGAIQQVPKLTKPVTRRVWVDPEISENGTVYIDGHWKYLLMKDAQWTK